MSKITLDLTDDQRSLLAYVVECAAGDGPPGDPPIALVRGLTGDPRAAFKALAAQVVTACKTTSAMSEARDVRSMPSSAARDMRQAILHEWAQAAFGVAEATSLPQRGIRLLEEAVEAFQSCEGSEDKAHALVTFVFSRPRGQLAQELGGVGVTALLLAAAAGLSAEDEERREVGRVLSKPVSHYTERNRAKNEAGFLVVPDSIEPR